MSDMLFTLSSIVEITEYIQGKWVFGDLFCRIHGTLIEIFYTVSILTLTVMAV